MSKFKYTYRDDEYPINLIKDVLMDDKKADRIMEEIDLSEIMTGLSYAVGMLPERMQRILKERYVSKLTYANIAKKEKVCSQRIKQILEKAIRMLRHPIWIGYIKNGYKGQLEFLEEKKKQRELKEEQYRKIQDETSERLNLDDIEIYALNLSVREFNALWRSGFRTVNDVIMYAMENKGLWRIRNLGTKSIRDIEDKFLYAGYIQDRIFSVEQK